MLHTFPGSLAYDQKLQDTDLGYLFSSEKALGSLRRTTWGCRSEHLAVALLPNQRLAWGSLMEALFLCVPGSTWGTTSDLSAHSRCTRGPSHCDHASLQLKDCLPGSRLAQRFPSATGNLSKTDAYARTAGPIASHQVLRSFAQWCRCQVRRWLEHDEAADAAF